MSKVGIAKVSFRDKEHLSALRFKDDAFVLETMFWPDEIREADFDESCDVDAKVREQELEMAKTLIENLTADWQPRGVHRRVPRGAAARSSRRRSPARRSSSSRPEPTAKVVDLMEALKASVDAAKKQPSGGRRLEEADGAQARREEAGCEEDGRSQGAGAEEGIGGVNLPPGFTSRPATPDDLDEVAALVEAWEHRALR